MTCLSRKVLKCFHNAPILVSSQECDWVHDGMNVGMDLVDSCLLVLSSDEENFTFTIDSLDELDIVYTRRMLQCI